MKSNQFQSQLNPDLSTAISSDYGMLLKQRNDHLLGHIVKNTKEGQRISGRLPSASGTYRVVRPHKMSLGKRLVLQMERGDSTRAVTPKKAAVEIITRRKPSGVTIRKRQVQPYAMQTEVRSLVLHPCDETLMRNSSRLRLLHSNKRKGFNNVLVLSSEFLLSENNFWRDEPIDQNVSAVYRKLSSVAEVIWVVKKEQTLQKLIDFCESNQLPLDAVYALQSKKKCSLTVNYKPILDQLSPTNHRILTFDVMRANQQMPLDDFLAYENKLPLGGFAGMSCYLIKTDRQLSHSQLLGGVLKVFIGSSTPVKQTVDGILNDYLGYLKQCPNNLADKKRRKASTKPFTSKRISEADSAEEVDEEQCQNKTLARIEQLKREWVPEIVKQNKSKNISGGDSVHYIVGDMLKRNFGLMLENTKQYEQRQLKTEVRQPRPSTTQARRVNITADYFAERLEYGVPVFVVCAF